MEANRFKNSMTVREAYNKILGNKSYSYEWYPVITKNGLHIKLGGTNKEIKAYFVSLDDNGKIKTYTNGFVMTAFLISIEQNLDGSLYEVVETSTKRKQIDCFLSVEHFLFYLERFVLDSSGFFLDDDIFLL